MLPREDAIDALNDILDALQDVLEDPVFTARDEPTSFLSFIRSGFTFHDDDFVMERLQLLHEQRPGKLDALARALEKASDLSGLQSPREKNRWYKLAIAPLIVPQVLGLLALLKFSSREAQYLVYYSVWLGQAIGLATLVSLFLPALAPSVLVWHILAEMMEKDLDAEELLGSLFLFGMMRASWKMETVLALCHEKGVECGKLVAVSERFAHLRTRRSRD